MRGQIEEETVVVEGSGDGCSEARKINKQLSARERIKAAELLGKRYRLFVDKVDVTGSVPVKIIDDIGDDEDEAE
jgi:phage terminase small subunit